MRMMRLPHPTAVELMNTFSLDVSHWIHIKQSHYIYSVCQGLQG